MIPTTSSATIAQLVSELHHGDRRRREFAARSLALLIVEVNRAIPYLDAALEDESPWVRCFARDALDEMAFGARSPDSRCAGANPPDPEQHVSDR